MDVPVTQLYPPPAEERALRGLYLNEGLREQLPRQGPLVYSNFIASLDGRISEMEPASGLRRVPAALANPRDWRLYMELAAQADVLLTSARHLRAVAQGRHGDLLGLDDGRYEDLRRWRVTHQLSQWPAVAAVCPRLELSAEQLCDIYPGPILLLTADTVPQSLVAQMLDAGIDVVRLGRGPRFSATELLTPLTKRGWRLVYSIAGPKVAHTLVRQGMLHRLYLTLALRTLGGEIFDTLLAGDAFAPAADFTLMRLCWDPAAPGDGGQLFVSLRR